LRLAGVLQAVGLHAVLEPFPIELFPAQGTSLTRTAALAHQ